MDAKTLKERIKLDNKIELILYELSMHHIQKKDDYYSCGMPDGDRTNSTIVYINSLHVDAYTRNIEDRYGHTDIISLVSFINKTYITQSIKWICDICGYSFYGEIKEIPETLKWQNEIYNMNSNNGDSEENEYIKPLNECVLKYYGQYQNKMFLDDGISLLTQRDFELGYDLETHSVTIPIRDELGTLTSVKARLYKEEIMKGESKYFYLYPCAKSKILYGLYKTMSYIKQKNEVIVVESEKAVMQLWSNNVKNAVAISGHILSRGQVSKITQLGVNVVLAYDQGVGTLENNKIDKEFYKKEFDKFLKNQSLAFMFDKSGKILKEKESPTDNFENFKKLYADRIITRK